VSPDDKAGWFVENGRGNSAEPDRVLLIIDDIISSAHLSRWARNAYGCFPR
jgi:hypothetical protein